ncbi:hypothetical protein Mboo_0354 [Methanoregula boonei 6A8]|uniref:Rad50/SbcC-type AAA domain-containing protein n=1 Tax=Methanoregula boonei (strain DSM 21154 / JCM 14090 / 6A8) TaxID=456442 RepID=A7I563_METB6|nr:hypothetical protein [Methanoregula boonei]ABS54874.1 hypothetical protein Mboo_0354 [Methanoregula boonei 6A8]
MAQDVFFEFIDIKGYRGRNFELKMNPPGEHTVFIMDGNTGKTTTIELIRWCFKHKESEAVGKFRHMWIEPAHVLDMMKHGPQTCTIKISFSDKKHRYLFTRVTKGEYLNEIDDNKKIIGDRINEVLDTLEIDSGADVISGDRVNQYLREQFRFGQSVDYFCFDGERARDLLIKASDVDNLDFLTSLINTRATHPILNHYNEQLEALKRKIYTKAKSRAPDRKIKEYIEKIEDKEGELKAARDLLRSNRDELAPIIEAIRLKNDEISELDKKRIQIQSEKYSEKLDYERQIDSIKQKWRDKRKFYYENSLNWLSHIDTEYLNKLKHHVREVGKLPEPYRKDLIYACLNHKPPICQICGRELDDDASYNHVKELENLVASHEVQSFLADKVKVDNIIFFPEKEYELLIAQYQTFKETETLKNAIVLSDEDNELVNHLNTAKNALEALLSRKRDFESNIQFLSNEVIRLEGEKQELESNLGFFKEYQNVLKNIERTQDTIITTQESMKEKTIGIISSVLSESISSILGPSFSANFSKDHGLLLGENNKFSPEIGGMSGRIILAYCFAEAMTLIDPIIIDTPSGNVGTHRDPLGQHLNVNHNQVICLCLPHETLNFAPHISKNPIEIENRGE